MYRRCLWRLGASVAVLFSLLHPWLARAQQGERLVLAFYYAWFDWNTWTKPLSDQPLAPYVSADADAIARHVQEARQAGIDALVQAWYGPDLENNQTEPNFRILLDKAQAYGLKAAVSVDMGGSFLQSSADVIAALVAVRDRHAQHPGYLHVNGRPVVFFWRQNNFSAPAWEAIRDQVDPGRAMLWIAEGTQMEYLATFDGLYLYSVAWSGDPAAVLARWGSEVRAWSADHDTFRYWVATAMPGYNDLVTGRSDAFVRERSNGAYYRACWDGVAQSQADWVVITSFNEWLEGTHIEPSADYGDTYIQLTAQLANNYRTVVYESTPTATPEPPTPTPEPPTATPEEEPTPTVELPAATATPAVTPTATLTPTATPFRLATPTSTPPPTPTFPPTAVLPPAPTVQPYVGVTPTSARSRPIPVEGGAPTKVCPILPAALPVIAILVARRRRPGPL